MTKDQSNSDQPEGVHQTSAQKLAANKQLQGEDKAPGEESGKGEPVTNDDLKGKKVDADIEDPQDAPLNTK